MWSDSLLSSTEALRNLDVHHEHFKALTELGIISALAWGADGEPRFSKNQTYKLRMQRQRLRAIIADNFGKRRQTRRYTSDVGPMPYYPYDGPGQAAWARRRLELEPRLWRSREARREIDAVMRVYERAARQEFSDSCYFDPDARVRAAAKITREQLYDLIWLKPMDPAAREVGMTETPLRQLCYECCIPTPPRGYFNFQDPVDRPPRTPLPTFPKRHLK